MNVIKFSGKDKTACVRRAVDFFHDNFSEDDEYTLEMFLAKCRFQKDGQKVHFYPYLDISVDKLRKKDKKEDNEKESTTGHRWSASQFLRRIWQAFK